MTKQTSRNLRHDKRPELPLNPDVIQPGQYLWPPHFSPALLLTVFIGGSGGAYARYWICQQLPSNATSIPSGTLFVNILGAFLLGVLLEGLARLGNDRGSRRFFRLLLGTGFMGAFTTYSTFAVEVDTFLRSGLGIIAVVYMAGSIVGGILACAAGISLASRHHKRRTRG